jgi:hypothetical protein
MSFHAFIFYLVRPAIQPATRLYLPIIKMNTQREMSFFASLQPPKFAPKSVIDSFASYRDAVIWCWENRVNTGAGEKADQAMYANRAGLQTPKMSRYVKRDSHAPMKLDPDYLDSFEAFCGWSAVSQFLAKRKQLTFMEQVLEERRAFA